MASGGRSTRAAKAFEGRKFTSSPAAAKAYGLGVVFADGNGSGGGGLSANGRRRRILLAGFGSVIVTVPLAEPRHKILQSGRAMRLWRDGERRTRAPSARRVDVIMHAGIST